MIFRSDRPLPPIPDRLLSAHVLADVAVRGDRPALTNATAGQTLSFPELRIEAPEHACSPPAPDEEA